MQDVTLGFGRAEGDEMRRGGSQGLSSLLGREALILLGSVAVVLTVAAVWLFERQLAGGAEVAEARNAVLLMVVLTQNTLLLSMRHLHLPVWNWTARENRWLFAGIAAALGLHLAAMQIPAMQQMLGLAPVSPGLFGLCLAGSLAVLAVAEAAKWAMRARATD